MITFTLTAAQLEEVQHKLDIVQGEPDLQEDFGMTQEDADALEALFIHAEPGEFTIRPEQARVIASELENAADIARGNFDAEGIKVMGLANSYMSVVECIRAQLGE